MKKVWPLLCAVCCILLVSPLGSLAQAPAQAETAKAPDAAATSINVFIVGAVAHFGRYNLKPGEGILELFALAGGPTPDAALSQVRITNVVLPGRPLNLNLRSAPGQGLTKVNVPLQNYDIVHVPHNWKNIYIGGAVLRPGQYPIPEDSDLTLADALQLAGGLAAGGTLQKMWISKPQEQWARLSISLSKIEEGQAVVLSDGDFITVFRKPTPRATPPAPRPRLWLLR